MIGTHGSLSPHAVTAACLVALAVIPGDANGQVGAIGAAPMVVASGESLGVGTGAHALQPPIWTGSGMQVGAGQWAGSATVASTPGTVQLGPVEAGFNYDQFVIGAFYAPSDRSTLGFSMFPYIGIGLEATGLGRKETSGRGDAAVFGKYQLWRSGNGKTRVSGVGSIQLPIGESGYGANGTVIGLGGAVSHQLERLSLHGSLSVAVPTDDQDGETAMNVSAAAVYGVSPRVALALELNRESTSLADGFGGTVDLAYVHLAPGTRFRIGNSLILTTSLLTTLSSSVDVKPFDYAFALGLELAR